MASWSDFDSAEPSLASHGRERLTASVAYLATVDRNGRPRLHPVTPVFGGGELYVFMEPTAPKGHDLVRGSGYALHAGVEDNAGGAGEFLVRGNARLVDDPAERAGAAAGATYAPADRYILFRLAINEVLATAYEGGEPVRRRWRTG